MGKHERNTADQIVAEYWKRVGQQGVTEADINPLYPYPKEYFKTEPGTEWSIHNEPGAQWGVYDTVRKITELTGQCPTYWGTHGCSKKKGHKNAVHICRDADTGKVCSKVTELKGPLGSHDTGELLTDRFAVDTRGLIWKLYE